MSVKHISWVWENSQAQGGARLVALALADSVNASVPRGDPDADACWPHQSVIAEKTLLSERQVQRAVAELVELGELVKERVGSRGNRYTFAKVHDPTHCRVTDPSPDPSPDNMSPDNMSPSPDAHVGRSPDAHVGSYVEPEVRTGKETEGTQTSLVPDAVEEVWAHYVQALARPKAQLTPKVRKWIATAIKDVGVEECKAAIDGLASSSYHREHGYVGIEYALRPREGQTTESRIEMMKAHRSSAQTAGSTPRVHDRLDRVPSDRRGIVRQRADDVVAARNSGQVNEPAEQTVREQLGLVPDIQDGRMIGWRQA